MKSWKTTLAGVAAILAVVSKAIHSGEITATDVATFMVGVGLIMGKDFNVTGK